MKMRFRVKALTWVLTFVMVFMGSGFTAYADNGSGDVAAPSAATITTTVADTVTPTDEAVTPTDEAATTTDETATTSEAVADTSSKTAAEDDNAASVNVTSTITSSESTGSTDSAATAQSNGTYTISFNKNGGTGRMANETMTFDVAANLTSNAFKRRGYVFAGWNTAADGSGTSYDDNASVINLTDVNGGKVTLYAQWRQPSYTIHFDANGGTGTTMADESIVFGVATTLTANAYSREGYTFACWTQAGYGLQFADQASVPTDVTTTNMLTNGSGDTLSDGDTATLYAQWTPNTYTISFDKNATDAIGTMADESMTYDEARDLTSNAYSRDGYVFAGWTTNADGSGTTYADAESVKNLTSENSGKVTLYAKWMQQLPTPSTKTYTIHFDSNYGTGPGAGTLSGTMADETMTYDESKNLTLNAFTVAGGVSGVTNITSGLSDYVGYCVFRSWNTKADGTGTTYADGTSVKNLTDVDGGTVTLYAQWSVKSVASTFTVHYRNSLDPTDTSIPDQTVNMIFDARYGGLVTTSIFTTPGRDAYAVAAGWNFVCWSTWENLDWNSLDNYGYGPKCEIRNLCVTPGGEVTLWAQYYPKGSYQGSVDKTWAKLDKNAADATGSFTWMDRLTDPSNPAYYTNCFWYHVGYSAPPQLTVMTGISTPTGRLLHNNYVETDNPLSNYFKFTGYTFTGWNTKADGSGVFYADEADITQIRVFNQNRTNTIKDAFAFYAQWVPHTYRVSFNKNATDATGSMDDEPMTYDTAANLTSNSYERKGYTFQGWTANADGSGTAYANAEEVKNLAVDDGVTITMNAKWTPNAYTIVFDKNATDATGSMDDESMTYDVSANLTSNAYERTGYTFEGWTTSADGSGTTYADAESVKNLTAEDGGTVILYAKWTKNATTTETVTTVYSATYLPKTGDDTPLIPIAVTAAAGLLFVMLALYRRRRDD